MVQHSFETMLATVITVVLLIIIIMVTSRAIKRNRSRWTSLSNHSHLVNGQLAQTEINLLPIKTRNAKNQKISNTMGVINS
jgi:F0F1-type ATP synthase membrane subunit a